MRFGPLASLGLCLATAAALGQPAPVPASRQTQPFPSTVVGVGDPAVWIHPTDVSQSLVLGVNGQDGLFAYDLDGGPVGAPISGPFASVDVRYQFPLAGQRVPLIATGSASPSGELSFFTVALDGGARTLVPISSSTRPLSFGGAVSCVALWHPPGTGDFELFALGGLSLQRWQLADDGTGHVTGTPMGTLQSTLTAPTGCAVDEAAGVFYATFASGFYRGDLLPDGGTLFSAIAISGSTPDLGATVAGVALIPSGSVTGYLLISSPGASGGGDTVFSLYDRVTNGFLGAFVVPDSGTLGPVQGSAGLAATNFGLSSPFDQGLVVVHDAVDNGNPPNFKLVSLGAVAGALGLPLNPALDPRTEGFAPDGGAPQDGGGASGGGGNGPGPGGGSVKPIHAGCTCNASGGGLMLALLALAWWASRRSQVRQRA